MHAQARHGAPVSGDRSRAIERAETPQQVARAREHGRRRLVQPRERPCVAGAPVGELEGEGCEIGIDDLRGCEGGERRVCTLAPRAIADAVLGAPGSALTLLGRSPRDALGLEATHAGGRIEACAPHQSRVDHHAHARYGETGLRDIGREHELARATGGWRERGVLRFGRELAVQRQHDHARGGRGLEQRLHAADLTRPGQEHQHVAVLLVQRPQDELRDDLFRGRGVPACLRCGRQQRQPRARVARFDREGAPRGPHRRRIAEQARDGRAVKCRGHDQNAQLGNERRAGVE